MKSRMTTRIYKMDDASSRKGLRPELTTGFKEYRAVRLALSVLCALVIYLLVSAPLGSAQTVSVPSACQGLQNELNGLIAERTDLQNQLKMAAPGEKPGLAGQILQLNKQITTKQNQVNNCAKTNGGKPDLNSSFKGTATMTTNNDKVKGPFVQSVNIGAFFPHWEHNKISITNFPSIKVGPFSTPIGSNTTTVTLIDNGNGPVVTSTGEVEVTVKLHFHHSLALATDSDLLITLSTEKPGGSRLKSNGALTLAGSSTFQGGYLGGSNCTLKITGTLSPLP